MSNVVYVLTSLMEGNEWRPVAVVTNEHVAEQWIQSGKDNDWILFELGDLSTTGLSKGQVTDFKPKPTQPTEKAMRDTISNLQTANAELKGLVDQLVERLKSKKRSSSASNPLLKKATYEYYHVTDRDSADAILREGFEGGWGDLGYGVYLWNGLDTTENYAARGGWDHSLKNPVILAVGDPEIQEITGADLDPNWDPGQYVDVYWHPMQEGAGNWHPKSVREIL
jgi:hypothetical protein